MANKEAFEALEAVFSRVVRTMPDEFDTHQFILKLARRYQKLYIQALYVYRDNDSSFTMTHRAIGKRLKKHETLVKQVGTRKSQNIFGLENRVALWRKVR